MKRLIFSFIFTAVIFLNNIAVAAIYNGYWQDSKDFTATYPIVDIDNKDMAEKINGDIQNTIQNYADEVGNGLVSKLNMTYYAKYEDNNIVNIMYYVNRKDLEGVDRLEGFTVTYDKHTGEKVPESRYLNITLAQLQNALNNSKAYAVDGLDNGVNIQRKIPYVSKNYFIVTDGSIGLLYQPGDLLNKAAGATKIIIAPETVKATYELNTR